MRLLACCVAVLVGICAIAVAGYDIGGAAPGWFVVGIIAATACVLQAYTMRRPAIKNKGGWKRISGNTGRTVVGGTRSGGGDGDTGDGDSDSGNAAGIVSEPPPTLCLRFIDACVQIVYVYNKTMSEGNRTTTQEHQDIFSKLSDIVNLNIFKELSTTEDDVYSIMADEWKCIENNNEYAEILREFPHRGNTACLCILRETRAKYYYILNKISPNNKHVHVYTSLYKRLWEYAASIAQTVARLRYVGDGIIYNILNVTDMTRLVNNIISICIPNINESLNPAEPSAPDNDVAIENTIKKLILKINDMPGIHKEHMSATPLKKHLTSCDKHKWNYLRAKTSITDSRINVSTDVSELYCTLINAIAEMVRIEYIIDEYGDYTRTIITTANSHLPTNTINITKNAVVAKALVELSITSMDTLAGYLNNYIIQRSEVLQLYTNDKLYRFSSKEYIGEYLTNHSKNIANTSAVNSATASGELYSSTCINCWHTLCALFDCCSKKT